MKQEVKLISLLEQPENFNVSYLKNYNTSQSSYSYVMPVVAIFYHPNYSYKSLELHDILLSKHPRICFINIFNAILIKFLAHKEVDQKHSNKFLSYVHGLNIGSRLSLFCGVQFFILITYMSPLPLFQEKQSKLNDVRISCVHLKKIR